MNWSSFGRRWVSLANAAVGRSALGLGTAATVDTGTTTGTVPLQDVGTWTPAITFGGAAVGVTYAGTTTGRYTKIGNVVILEGILILTAKGSSVGAAVITGLPFANAITTSCSVGFWQNMATIGSISGVPASATTTIQLFNSGAVSVAALTDANFTNTSSLRFSAAYLV